jgi:hypothetical protein
MREALSISRRDRKAQLTDFDGHKKANAESVKALGHQKGREFFIESVAMRHHHRVVAKC